MARLWTTLTSTARATLRTGDRAICSGCGGCGKVSRSQGRVDCSECRGKGAVCPKCHGQRFVLSRPREFDWGGDVIRCPACTEGNNVNEMAEMRQIKRYIALSDALADDDDERIGKVSGRDE